VTFVKSSSLSSAALAADAAIAAYLRSLADQSAAALVADGPSSSLARNPSQLPRALVLVRRGGSAAVVS
jgi:hypothetical protein